MTRSAKIRIFRQGASMLFCPAALPRSRQTLTYTAGVIRRHRAQIGSPWRKLTCGQQALLVLAYLRKGETFAELAAGFGIGTSHRLAVRHRDGGPAGRPLPETAQGAAGCQAGRARPMW
jgi:Helix-turn-helix of DDE superfamily endonuclease